MQSGRIRMIDSRGIATQHTLRVWSISTAFRPQQTLWRESFAIDLVSTTHSLEDAFSRDCVIEARFPYVFRERALLR